MQKILLIVNQPFKINQSFFQSFLDSMSILIVYQRVYLSVMERRFYKKTSQLKKTLNHTATLPTRKTISKPTHVWGKEITGDITGSAIIPDIN